MKNQYISSIIDYSMFPSSLKKKSLWSQYIASVPTKMKIDLILPVNLVYQILSLSKRYFIWESLFLTLCHFCSIIYTYPFKRRHFPSKPTLKRTYKETRLSDFAFYCEITLIDRFFCFGSEKTRSKDGAVLTLHI